MSSFNRLVHNTSNQHFLGSKYISGNRQDSINYLQTKQNPQPIIGQSRSSIYNKWEQINKTPLDDKEKAIIPFLWGYAFISVLLSLSIWRNFYNIAVEKKKSTLSVGKFRLILSIIILIISPIITGIYTFTKRRVFKFPLYIYFTITFLIQFVIIATI